jgi:hypothetical protein
VADRALRAEPADIVTWWNDGYDPVNEVRDLGRGRFRPTARIVAPALVATTRRMLGAGPGVGTSATAKSPDADLRAITDVRLRC